MSVSGAVRYYAGGEAVADSMIQLEGVVTVEGQTDADGTFSLMVPGALRRSRLSVAKRQGAGEAVSALDAVYILQHLVDARELTPNQVLACDATGDGKVTALDAARILDLAVGEIASLPVVQGCDSDWLFRVESEVGEGGVISCSNSSIEVDALAGAIAIVGVLPGDCTGNWSAEAAASRRAVAPGGSRARVRVGRLRVRGGRALLPVYLRSPSLYNSIDMKVAYDSATLRPTRVRIRRKQGNPIVRMNSNPDEGMLRLAVASAEPFNRGRRQLVIVEFDVLAAGPVLAPRLVTLRIDERSPRLPR